MHTLWIVKILWREKNSCTFLTSSTNQVLEERLSRNKLHSFTLLSFWFILCWNLLPSTENNRSPSASITMEIVNHMLWPLQSPFCVSSHSPPLPSNTKWGNIFWKHGVPPLSLNSENRVLNRETMRTSSQTVHTDNFSLYGITIILLKNTV